VFTISARMSRRLGQQWSVQVASRALAELGFVLKKPEARTRGADPAKQQAFLNFMTTRGLSRELFVFLDEVGSVIRLVITIETCPRLQAIELLRIHT